jgi:hypothetical protein
MSGTAKEKTIFLRIMPGMAATSAAATSVLPFLA